MAGRFADRFRALGYTVFFDVESMRSGVFNTQILEAIENCNDVLVVLPPNALDRCVDESDWVRKEIAFAIQSKKNIIPIMMRNFTFPDSLPCEINQIKDFQGVTASIEYFDAVVDRIESLLVSNSLKNTQNLREKYLFFISSVTEKEYLQVEEYFQNGNDISVSGGIFYFCNSVLTSNNMLREDTAVEGRRVFSKMLLASKILYKLAKDKGFIDLCSLMQKISVKEYLSSIKNIQEYMLQEYPIVQGEFIDFIWQKLYQYQNFSEDKEYWDELIKEIFLFLRLFSANSIFSDKSATRTDCISFLSSISISDYLKTKKSLENGNDVAISSGIFHICKMILNNHQNDAEAQKLFGNILLIYKILYKLSEEKKYIGLCELMRTVSQENYRKASTDIKEYMTEEHSTLQGEFITLVWQSLFEYQNDEEKKEYWERWIKEIFIFLRLCS